MEQFKIWETSEPSSNLNNTTSEVLSKFRKLEGTEFQVNTNTDGFKGLPSIGALSDGGFVVTWTSAV